MENPCKIEPNVTVFPNMTYKLNQNIREQLTTIQFREKYLTLNMRKGREIKENSTWKLKITLNSTSV